MEPPFITILTASLNNQTTIEETLLSVQQQTFKAFEHIVIDGGSRDQTCVLLEKYASIYNLKYISEVDSGIAEALNKGLKMASGRYILVLQADDKLFNNLVLERVWEELKGGNIDIQCYPILFDDPHRGKIRRDPIRFLWWNHFKFVFLHQGCFVHRRVFHQIGGFNPSFRISFDYDFFYRALMHERSVEFGKFPVSIMGGVGVGSIAQTVHQRLEEETIVQKINETRIFWRILQTFFWTLYHPYKKMIQYFSKS